jgi:ubiquitin-conjugating enzyme E2 G2
MAASSGASSGSASAVRRLTQEYRDLTLHPPEGVVAGPAGDGANLFVWEVQLAGPEGTDFEGGLFEGEMKFPRNYPLSPPTLRFTSDLYHPNIYETTGDVCISILHPPGDDPLAYEHSCERWSPVQSVEKILLSVVSMLAEPNIESPANVDAAKLFRDDPEAFAARARACVAKSLGFDEDEDDG